MLLSFMFWQINVIKCFFEDKLTYVEDDAEMRKESHKFMGLMGGTMKNARRYEIGPKYEKKNKINSPCGARK